jgi:FdhD protein
MPTDDNAPRRDSAEEAAGGAVPPLRRVEPLRVSTEGGPAVRDPCDVVVEDVLTIKIEGVGSIAVMCTPTDTVALALGFLFAEGMIADTGDIAQLTPEADPYVVTISIVGAQPASTGRDLVVTSSCGMCGSREIDSLLRSLKPGEDKLRIAPSTIRDVAEQMRGRQALFSQTGGTHAAAIFSADGEIITMGEDIGRHNALDKAVGKCLLEKLSLSERGVMLSGRISLEMLCKAARAGIELVAAVSAPSSLAIEAAQRCNITLCGFVRADRATVYTHPHRLQGLDTGA